MNYITNVARTPLLYGYRTDIYRHRYIADRVQTYREELLRQYAKPSSRGKLAEYHYICLSPRTRVQGSAIRKIGQDALDWARLLYQVSMPYSNNHKEVAVKKSKKMGIRLMELKTDGSHYEFLIRESIMDEIVTWECLPGVDAVKEYLKEHPFPQDKLYPEKAFLDDVAKTSGYIRLVVEKSETAEFICDLCSALI